MHHNMSGYIPSPIDERDYKINRLVKNAPHLPDTYLTKVPLKIFDQEDSNMCVGCAIATMKHVIESRQTGDNEPFSPAYIYANRRHDDYQGEGMVPREALKNLQNYGICHLYYFPGNYTYFNAQKYYALAKPRLDEKARPYRISSYYRLNSTSDIKTAIYTLGCAMVAYDVYECLFNPRSDGVVEYNENTRGECQGGHQMLAIGYNEIGFIVVNSWSTDYGIGNEELGIDGGLVIIPYDYKPTESWAVVDDITEKEVKALYGPRKISIFKKITGLFTKK